MHCGSTVALVFFDVQWKIIIMLQLNSKWCLFKWCSIGRNDSESAWYKERVLCHNETLNVAKYWQPGQLNSNLYLEMRGVCVCVNICLLNCGSLLCPQMKATIRVESFSLKSTCPMPTTWWWVSLSWLPTMHHKWETHCKVEPRRPQPVLCHSVLTVGTVI